MRKGGGVFLEGGTFENGDEAIFPEYFQDPDEVRFPEFLAYDAAACTAGARRLLVDWLGLDLDGELDLRASIADAPPEDVLAALLRYTSVGITRLIRHDSSDLAGLIARCAYSTLGVLAAFAIVRNERPRIRRPREIISATRNPFLDPGGLLPFSPLDVEISIRLSGHDGLVYLSPLREHLTSAQWIIWCGMDAELELDA